MLKELFLKEGLRGSLTWLVRGSPLILRITVLLFLMLSLSLVTVIWLDVAETNQVVMRALSSPIGATPHPNSAIEALLLASVLSPDDSDGGSAVRSSAQPVSMNVTGAFSNDMKTIEDILAKPSSNASPKKEDDSASLPEIINSRPGGPSNLSDAILSDREDGFLFVPGAILPSISTDNPTAFIQSLKSNPALVEDIALTKTASSLLCGDLTQKYGLLKSAGNVFSPAANPDNITSHYQQAYLIFRSGVTRLCESSISTSWEKQREYYANKFTPRTQLQTRPYFEPTVQERGVNYFHSTKPYIDLGGNSVVETFCRYLPVGKHKQGIKETYRTDAVLCFDFQLNTDLKSVIRSEISRFGGSATELGCERDNCRVIDSPNGVRQPFLSKLMSVFYPSASLDDREVTDITSRFVESKNQNQESTFFGDITILGGDKKSGVIKFTVPLGGAEILAIKLDIKTYQEWRTIWLSLAAACIVITGILILLILADYGMKFKEQERAFAAVDCVMSDVPVPYARLNEEGEFLEVNEAFAKLMQYGTAAEATAELNKYKYEEFLADQASKLLYQTIRQERRDGKPYRSYSVQLWTGRSPGRPPIKWLKVHGSDVPTPHTSRKKPGQSFGILLPTDVPKPMVVMEPKVQGESSEKSLSDQAKTG